jgi:hypothetical protein
MPRRILLVLPMVALLLGCASDPTSQAVLAHVTPGLANVPWISGSTAINDQKIPDVVSNGLEACGRGAEHQFLPGQWPPCPTPTLAVSGRELLPTTDSEASAKLVRPWKESTVFEWPCTPVGRAGDSTTVILCR